MVGVVPHPRCRRDKTQNSGTVPAILGQLATMNTLYVCILGLASHTFFLWTLPTYSVYTCNSISVQKPLRFDPLQFQHIHVVTLLHYLHILVYNRMCMNRVFMPCPHFRFGRKSKADGCPQSALLWIE